MFRSNLKTFFDEADMVQEKKIVTMKWMLVRKTKHFPGNMFIDMSMFNNACVLTCKSNHFETGNSAIAEQQNSKFQKATLF